MTKKIKYTSNRGQGVLLVLYCLKELGAGSPNSKQEVLTHIRNNKYYDINQSDLPSYKSQNEPKYETLLCWARKDALENEWLLRHDERDHWQLSKNGVTILDAAKAKFRSSEWEVRKCYLWNAKFKAIVDPAYIPSDKDKVRPLSKHSILDEFEL